VLVGGNHEQKKKYFGKIVEAPIKAVSSISYIILYEKYSKSEHMHSHELIGKKN